jgi:hypothetical protein
MQFDVQGRAVLHIVDVLDRSAAVQSWLCIIMLPLNQRQPLLGYCRRPSGHAPRADDDLRLPKRATGGR